MKHYFTILIATLSFIIAACVPVDSPSNPPDEANNNEPPPEMLCKDSDKALEQYDPAKLLVDKQLLLLGKKDDIGKAIEAIKGEPLAHIEFGKFSQLSEKLEGAIYDDWTDVELHLLQIDEQWTQNGDLFSIYTKLYTRDLTTSEAFIEPVYVDFNYLTGRSPVSGSGDPSGVGAHPFGSAAATPATIADFAEQWAFNKIAAYDGNGDMTLAMQDIGLGAESVVAVFDTSPYEAMGSKTVNDFQLPGQSLLTLEVLCPWISKDQQPGEFLFDYGEDKTPAHYKSHGLFVAGLVYGVAPKSELHLIRVLDDAGVGDLFWLINGLVYYLDQESPKPIINLSLGVQADEMLTPAQVIEVEALIEGAGLNPSQPNGCNAGGIPLLCTILQAASEKYGAVIVAAAGNDSAGNATNQFTPEDPALPAQIPASYEFVYSVGASNIEDNRSCFSNEGDWIAPGGGALLPGSLSSCDPIQIQTCMSPDCPLGLLSLILNNESWNSTTGKYDRDYEYALWAGTSFATPLLSGAMTNVRREIANDADIAASFPTNFPPPIFPPPNKKELNFCDVLTTLGLQPCN